MTTAILIGAGVLLSGLIGTVVMLVTALIKAHSNESNAREKIIPLQSEIVSLKESLDKANARGDTLTQALADNAAELEKEIAVRKQVEESHNVLVKKLSETANPAVVNDLIRAELELLQKLSKTR